MKTKFISRSLKSLFLLSSIFFFHSLQAVTITFTGATNNDWATGSNWSTGSVPTSIDVIIIDVNKTVVISNGTTVTVEKMTLNAGASLTNNGTLTIAPGLNTSGATTGSALTILGTNTFRNDGILTITSVNQTTVSNAISINGTGSTLTFNGTNNLAAKDGSNNLFTAAANATATIAGNGFTIGSAGTNVAFTPFSITSAGTIITINSGTTLNLYVGAKNVFYMANSAAIINNGTINTYTTTTGTSPHAIQIWQGSAGVFATFTNNGTLLMSGFEQPTVYGGSNTGSTGYGKFENTGTFTTTYPGISSGTSTGTLGIYSSSSLPNVFINSGTMNLHASYRSIALNAKAAGGSFTNTGTINITKGRVFSGGTIGTFSTYQTIDNNSGGVINFNYGVSGGGTTATEGVIINNNSGATINGSCTFAANTLVTAAGSTLSPGDYTGGASGYGKMVLTPSAAGTKFPLNGSVLMQIKGKNTAGTDYDRIECTEIDVTGASLSVTASYATYTPALNDYITLIYAGTSKTGPFSSISMPRGWIYESVLTNEAAKYFQSAPGAPTSVIATAGNAKTSISFAAPASDGGADITSYTVTSSPSGLTATGAASPLTVSGLTNETAYTFTVTATNIRGTGSASTASGSVTPSATANIIPVSSSTNISALTLTPVSDVVVSKDGVLTINQLANINSLTVAAGGKVTNTSTFTTPVLTLNSNAADGTATYLDNGTSTITTLNANQYLGTTRNWYVSSPVLSTASSASNILRYYEYVEAGNNADLSVSGSSAFWKGYNPGHTIVAGKGYIALPSAPSAAISFSGTMNTGNVSVSLSKTNAGYNLIGNPYPSHLTWTKAYVDSKAAQIEPTIWYRTNSGSSNANGWSFITYNASTEESTPALALKGIIPPMQAFWVKAVAAGTLVLNSDLAKSHQTSNPLKVPAAKNTERKRVRLQVSSVTRTDETLLMFDGNASDGYDVFDSPKFAESNSEVQIYTSIGNEKLVMNGMKNMPLNQEIALGFVPGSANSFSIKANEISNLPVGVKVILKDNANQAETDLTDGTASYNFSPATTSNERFSLIFRSAGVSTDIENTNRINAQVFVNAANQITIIAPEKSIYAIYNAVGQLSAKGTISHLPYTINHSKGVYVVKVGNLSNRVIIK